MAAAPPTPNMSPANDQAPGPRTGVDVGAESSGVTDEPGEELDASTGASTIGSSSVRRRPGATNSSTPTSTIATTVNCVVTLTSARRASHRDQPAGHGTEAPEPVQAIHHRRVTPGAQGRALHVHRHVDEDVEEQQPEQPDCQHDGRGRDADHREEADRERRRRRSAHGDSPCRATNRPAKSDPDQARQRRRP